MFTHGGWGGLFADPTFQAAYWARLGELLDGPLSKESIDAFIDQSAAELDEAAARNFARWSDYPPRGSYRDEVEALREWMHRRHTWMSGCLLLPDPRACVGD